MDEVASVANPIEPMVVSLTSVVVGAVLGWGVTSLKEYFETQASLGHLKKHFKTALPVYIKELDKLIDSLSMTVKKLKHDESSFFPSPKIEIYLIKNLPISGIYDLHELTKAFGYHQLESLYCIFGMFENLYLTQMQILDYHKQFQDDYVLALNSSNESFAKIKSNFELTQVQLDIPCTADFIKSYNTIKNTKISQLIDLVRVTNSSNDLQKHPHLKEMLDSYDRVLHQIQAVQQGLIEELTLKHQFLSKYKLELQEKLDLLD